MYLKVTQEYTRAKKAFRRLAYWVKNTFLWQLHNCTKTTHLTAYVCATTHVHTGYRGYQRVRMIFYAKNNVLTYSPKPLVSFLCFEHAVKKEHQIKHDAYSIVQSLANELGFFFGHSRVYYNNTWATCVPMPLIPIVWGWFQH